MINKNNDQNRYLLHVQASGAVSLPQSLAHHGWSVKVTQSPTEAKQLAQSDRFSVGLVSFDGQSRPSLSVIREVIAADGIEWIALVDDDFLDWEDLTSLICESCHDYHTLPVDAERLKVTLGRASGLANLKQHYCAIRPYESGNHEVVGDNQMQAVYRSISKIAALEAPVLITGETGTGKERAARSIHTNSRRAPQPFIAINCAALPAELLQSELFGHEKGSFTGAFGTRIGRIEAAQGGTLFLDEIGDLRLDLQVTLLRFLEEKTIERLGGASPIEVDVRVIAATNTRLEEAIEAGRFREDLYYRLNVLRIKLPPLRERPEDIEILARHFFEKFKGEQTSNVNGFSGKALHALSAHAWPGNVRELQNRVHRAVGMCEHRRIAPADLGLESLVVDAGQLKLKGARDQAEKQVIEVALVRNRYRIAPTARSLGVSHVTLYRLLKKHAIGVRHFSASHADPTDRGSGSVIS